MIFAQIDFFIIIEAHAESISSIESRIIYRQILTLLFFSSVLTVGPNFKSAAIFIFSKTVSRS